jgi:hypothetical protein
MNYLISADRLSLLWAAEHHRSNFDPDHVSVRSTPTH